MAAAARLNRIKKVTFWTKRLLLLAVTERAMSRPTSRRTERVVYRLWYQVVLKKNGGCGIVQKTSQDREYIFLLFKIMRGKRRCAGGSHKTGEEPNWILEFVCLPS